MERNNTVYITRGGAAATEWTPSCPELEKAHEFNRADVCAVIDGLMSGRRVVILGERSRALAAAVNALKALPDVGGTNIISFDIAATRESAALSRLSVGTDLDFADIAALEAGGYYIADVYDVRTVDELVSSTARIVYADGDCNAIKSDTPHAADCDGYLSGVEGAARRRELMLSAAAYADAEACRRISQQALVRYLMLYIRSADDFNQKKYCELKDSANAGLKTLAQFAPFGRHYAELDDEQAALLCVALEKFPEPTESAVCDLLYYGTAESVLRFIKMCYDHVDGSGKDGAGAVKWLCALLGSESCDLRAAVGKFIDGLDKKSMLHLAGMLDENSELFAFGSSGRLIKTKLLELYASEADRREAYAALHTAASRNTDWLLAEAYKHIADEADLKQWAALGIALKGEAHAKLASSFRTAFSDFLAAHPMTAVNYEAYGAAADALSYNEIGFRSELESFNVGVGKEQRFERRRDENFESRKAFVNGERAFLPKDVGSDGEVESAVYRTTFKRRRTFGGGAFLWWLAALVLSAGLACCAVLAERTLNIPWAEFFSSLTVPIDGVPVNAIFTVIPIALSVTVSMLAYLVMLGKTNRAGKRLARSVTSALCFVILPYLAFIGACGILYYLV